MKNIDIPLKYPVISDPQILSGTPVIKGSRVPASLVFDLFKNGWNVQLINTEYPSISRGKLSAFLALMSKSFDVSSTAQTV
jgi:uncharacterized protein (DUF433 family)